MKFKFPKLSKLPKFDYYKSIKVYLTVKYSIFFEFLTIKLLNFSSKMVRKVLIMKGKDPDFVPQAPKVQSESLYHNHRMQFNTMPYNKWVKDPSNHPILLLRQGLKVSEQTEEKVNSVDPVIFLEGKEEDFIKIDYRPLFRRTSK